MGKLMVGIVGAGIVAGGHLESFSRMSDTVIGGIADPDLEAARKAGARYAVERVVRDYRELLEDPALDLVVICTPHFLHHPIALEAFAAGKHVICEKPIAMNISQADEMIQSAQKAGKRSHKAFHGNTFTVILIPCDSADQ